MGPLPKTPQRRVRWHLPVVVFIVITAAAFASLRIARSAILSDDILNAGTASPNSAQISPVDPIESTRQALLESLAVDNQRFDILTQQRNTLGINALGGTQKTSASRTVPRPRQSLSEVRSQLASALADLINLEKSPYASGSEILSVRNRITHLQKLVASLEAHKASPQPAPQRVSPQPPSQTALLDQQIAQTQQQTITDLLSLAQLQKDHPAPQAVHPIPAPPKTLSSHDTDSSRLIMQASAYLRRLHMSASQRAAITSISAPYAFALSISIGFILSLFTLLVSEGLRASA